MNTLLASTTVTTSGDSGDVPVPNLSAVDSAAFLLTVTDAATLAGDTLDVFVQSSPDEGTTWDDLVRFTRILGNGGAKVYVAYWSRLLAPTSALHAPQDGAMSAGVNQGPIGNRLRVKWVVTIGMGGNPSFAFGVTMDAVRRR